MNNYEKINSMSLDEMAKFYSDCFGCTLCPCEWTSENNDCGNDCHNAIKQWLLKECE